MDAARRDPRLSERDPGMDALPAAGRAAWCRRRSPRGWWRAGSRFPGLRSAVPFEDLEWRRSLLVRGLRAFPVIA